MLHVNVFVSRFFVFFKQKTAYELLISDWSSDVCSSDLADQLRTLHALITCSLMTLLVFFLLALSSIPVLRAIGSTVTLGVLGNFVLALLVSRQPAARV